MQHNQKLSFYNNFYSCLPFLMGAKSIYMEHSPAYLQADKNCQTCSDKGERTFSPESLACQNLTSMNSQCHTMPPKVVAWQTAASSSFMMGQQMFPKLHQAEHAVCQLPGSLNALLHFPCSSRHNNQHRTELYRFLFLFFFKICSNSSMQVHPRYVPLQIVNYVLFSKGVCGGWGNYINRQISGRYQQLAVFIIRF